MYTQAMDTAPKEERSALEDGAREGTLERKRGRGLGLLLDLDVEAGTVESEPSKLWVGSRPAVPLLLEPVDRAVVHDLAVLVTPRRVHDSTNR